MSDTTQQLPPKYTLLLILLPLLGTFACQRLYLHLVRVQHVYPGGHRLHHLFVGVLIVILAAFLFGLWDAPAIFGDLGARGVRNWQRNDGRNMESRANDCFD